MRRPTAALAEPLKRTEDGAGWAQSSVAGGNETLTSFPTERVSEFVVFLKGTKDEWCVLFH